MNIKNILTVVMTFVMGFALQSCSDDDNNGSATSITVSKDGDVVDELVFNMQANSTIIGVDADGDWTAQSSDDSWLTLSNHAGYADTLNTTYTKVSVTKNEGATRQGTITIASGGLTKVINVTQKGNETDEGDPFEDAFTFVKNLRVGYNLGNTLEANPDINTATWIDFSKGTEAWETAWGQPVTTQEIIDDIAAKGFNIIRVPVTWYPHMDADGNVDAAWMDRVQQVVDMVLSTGCYCVINVMHDSGAKDAARLDDAGWLRADMESYATSSVRFKKLWQQIATRFKDYDQKLLFEAFNEILNSQYSWTAPIAGSTDYEAIRLLEQDFVDVVRATGGNNEWRNLVITTYAATTSQDAIDELAVPNDVHTNHLVCSLHTYDPYNFCNDNGEWNIKVFDSSCEQEIDNLTLRVDKRFAQLGIPYFYGEFGAIDTGKDMNERVKYAAYMAKKMTSYGTTGLWWMGLYDRQTRQWTEPDIVNQLMSAFPAK